MTEIKKVEEKSLNFIEEIIEEDLKAGKYKTITTRFPPEPNGYLHIGHAKSICLNFGLTLKYGGKTNLRFDDTNPITEDTEYVESIKSDVQWLGFQWANELYASDYFEQLYGFAVKLIRKGLAYVDDSTSEEIAAQKGTPTSPGTRNQYAERSIEENLRLFEEMRAGNMQMARKYYGQRLIWPLPTCTSVIRSCTASSMRSITVQVMPGASIPCTILRMVKVIPSKISPILFVRWSSFPTVRCTTG
jgi:glutaminyl-tRNA synthetase